MNVARLFSVRSSLVAAALCLAATSAGASDGTKPDFSAWLEDAPGLAEAARMYQEEARPIFVYFYTDWCPYCRQFESDLLTSDEVSDFLGGIVAVRVNAERGPAEQNLSQRYGVRGFPALFVLSGESKNWTRVERMVLEDGRPQLKSPGVFVDTLKQASAR